MEFADYRKNSTIQKKKFGLRHPVPVYMNSIAKVIKSLSLLCTWVSNQVWTATFLPRKVVLYPLLNHSFFKSFLLSLEITWKQTFDTVKKGHRCWILFQNQRLFTKSSLWAWSLIIWVLVNWCFDKTMKWSCNSRIANSKKKY